MTVKVVDVPMVANGGVMAVTVNPLITSVVAPLVELTPPPPPHAASTDSAAALSVMRHRLRAMGKARLKKCCRGFMKRLPVGC